MESLMLFALGFLIATLFAIIAGQFIWRRAVAVTTRTLNGGEGHEDLHELLEDRNARLAELSKRLEKLEAQGASSSSTSIIADDAEKHRNVAEELRQTEVEAERLRTAEIETSREMESLRDRLTEMEEKLNRSEAERLEQEERIAAMTRRIGEFETELEADTRRKEETGAALRAIGERAARLAYDLNNIVEEVAPRAKPKDRTEEAPEKSVPNTGTDETEAAVGKPDDGVADSLQELTERVHAAYGTPNTQPASTEENGSAGAGEADNENDDDEVPIADKPTGSPLDERIRALEAGLPH